MSSSDVAAAPARVELASTMASIELSIVASDFRPIAQGVGRLSVDVPPGIYQVVARAGPIIDRRLISLGPGERHVDTGVSVAFPSAAPIRETSTWREYHETVAQEASRIAQAGAGDDAGLVLVIRDARGREGPPLTGSELSALSLLDQSLRPMAGFVEGWTLHGEDAIATWSRRLPAGGYALRVDPARVGRGAPDAETASDQSVWLSRGWKTIVFLLIGDSGIQLAASSVHMVDMGMEWYPQETWQGLAIELAQWGLREGRSVVPDDLMGILLGSKFENPMLGILGAHSLLLRRPVDLDVVATVVGNLERLVPGHPDVVALRVMADRARSPQTAPPADAARQAAAVGPPSVAWPAMLLDSYRALVRRDAAQPGTIVDGSPAEQVAASVVVQSIWTSWRPLGPPLIGVAAPGASGAPTAVWVLPAVAADPQRLRATTYDDPATARVASYLSAVATLEGPGRSAERFATLSPQEIGIATSLPAASVDRALSGIAATVSLPPTGGDGSPERSEPDEPAGRGHGADSVGETVTGRGVPLAFTAAGIVGAAIAGLAIGALAGSGLSAPTPAPSPIVTAAASIVTTPSAFPSDIPSVVPSAVPSEPTAAPVAVLRVPEAVQFLETEVGAADRQEVLLRVRRAPLTIRTFSVAGPQSRDFGVEPGDCPEATIAAGAECTAIAIFEPTAAGDRVAELIIETSEVGSQHVPLAGTATQAAAPVGLSVRPSALDFGQVTEGDSAPLPLLLTANSPVGLSDWTIGGDAAADYEFLPIDCAGRVFEAAEACAVVVTFDPQAVDTRSAVLQLFPTEGDPLSVPLTGIGLSSIE